MRSVRLQIALVALTHIISGVCSCQSTVGFASLELLGPVFSGNGIYAKTILEGILAEGTCVVVFSGRSSAMPLLDQPDSIMDVLRHPGVVKLVDIEIPSSKWFRLDALSGWREFVDRIVACWAVACAPPMQAFVAVDYHASAAYAALKRMFSSHRALPPMLYLNFRVYSTSVGLAGPSTFYSDHEAAAVSMASLSIALSYRDAQILRELAQVSTVNIGFEPNVTVLLPALRQDVLELALARTPTPRQYFTCCVRLSPEKNASLWIDLVEELVNEFDFFAKTGLTPALCAPAGLDNAYATAIVDRLRAVAPSSYVIDRFLAPAELATLFSSTALNVHPPLYDAYGMTIVEAAAFGAPSLVSARGARLVCRAAAWCDTPASQAPDVGALGLVRPCFGEAIGIDMAAPIKEIAEAIAALFDQARPPPCDMNTIGTAARAAALLWTPARARHQFKHMLQTAMDSSKYEARAHCSE